eukprot:356348-Chlamydomonas_euryale.AAC.6
MVDVLPASRHDLLHPKREVFEAGLPASYRVVSGGSTFLRRYITSLGVSSCAQGQHMKMCRPELRSGAHSLACAHTCGCG